MVQHVIVSYNGKLVNKIIKILESNDVKILGIAILAEVKDTRILGGIRRIDREKHLNL